MKGMSHTLVIIVTAIVILVAALVVLTIFGSTITRFSTLTEAKTYCSSIATPLCAAAGNDAAVKSQLQNVKLEMVYSSGNKKLTTCKDIAEQANCNCEKSSEDASAIWVWNCK